MKKTISKIIKSLLVLLIITSKLTFPISVLADELEQSNENQEEVSEELEQLADEQDETDEETGLLDEELNENIEELVLLDEEQDETNEESELENEEQVENSGEQEPLDEELESTEEEINNYKITINEEELTEDNFNIENQELNNIKIIQEYTGVDTYTYSPIEIMEIDYSDRLYGEYSYELSVSLEEELIESKNIIINYIGNNNELINNNNIYYHNNTYYILGDINNELTVLDVISKFNNNLDIYNATLNIVDTELNQLLDTDIVENNYQLHLKAIYNDYEITNEIEEYYNLFIVSDINEDEVIDNKDIQKLLLENILNEETEEDETLPNIIDITNILLSDVKEESTDNLTTSFEYNGNVFLDEEVIVKYYIEGFTEDTLKGIEGKIKYDKNILELTNIEINSIDGGINELGHFIYLLDDYKENGLLLTITFKSLAIGSTTITLEDIIGATGAKTKANLDTDNYEAEINVEEYGTGGDVEPEEEITPPEEEKEIVPVYKPTYKPRPVLLSGDNSIKSLNIKNHDIKFDKNVLEYELNVKSNIKSLDLNIELNNSNATYEVIGNESFVPGENIVKIVVTAENKNQQTYTIKVNKEAKEVIEEETEETNSTSKAIVIFLIILVIIGLVYVIFKDDEEDKK